MTTLFTSESVTEGHPDKIADAVSDGILDALLAGDPASHVAVETMVGPGFVTVSGEVTTQVYVDIDAIVRDRITAAGYDRAEAGFDGHTCGVLVAISAQSPDIAQGVTAAEEARDGSGDAYDAQGAGDQGFMFGYATDETTSLMPAPIHIAHALSAKLAAVRKDGTLTYLRPDGKTQVTIVYDGDTPVAVDTVVISTQHAADTALATIRADLLDTVITPTLAPYGLDTAKVKVYVNPTGRFVFGGPAADVGITGRKIIVDTYGGMARHGGGAFSGKDPSKVDRSAAYAARWAAKNVVAAGLAHRCELQVGYAIGRARPVSIHVETFGTQQVDPAKIEQAVEQVFDLRPKAIIDQLDLLRPIYSLTTNYGHFGRELPDFTWERTDRVDALKAAL